MAARKYDSKSTKQAAVKPKKLSNLSAYKKIAASSVIQRKPVTTSAKPLDEKQQEKMRKKLQKQQPASNQYDRWLRPFRTIDAFK